MIRPGIESTRRPVAPTRAGSCSGAEVGRLSRGQRATEWDVSLLYQPEINVHFGLAHLANSLRRSPHLAHALAAYNAGTRAADQWAAFPGTRNDPELFIERIQYAETRDYVRRILRYQATYRGLYPVAP